MANWKNFQGGYWKRGANWDSGFVPNATGEVATFNVFSNNTPAGAAYIDLTASQYRLATLNLASTERQSYLLANGKLDFRSLTANPTINVTASGARAMGNILNTNFDLGFNAASGKAMAINTGVGAMLDIQGNISGTGLLEKQGAGTLRLSGTANGRVGETKLVGGTLEVASSAAFGNPNYDITISASGTWLRGVAPLVVLGNDLTIKDGVSTTISAATGTTFHLASSSIHADARFNQGANSTLHFGTTTDKGTVALFASRGNLGDNVSWFVDGGTLQTTTGWGAKLTLASGARLEVWGDTLFRTIAGTGTIASGGFGGFGAPEVKLRVGDIFVANDTTFAGQLQDGGRALALDLWGSGRLTLTNSNTYIGNTYLYDGTLALSGNGSISNSHEIQFGNVWSNQTFDISGISADSTSIRSVSGAGILVLGGKTLNVTNQLETTNGFTSFQGSAGIDRINVTLDANTVEYSLGNGHYQVDWDVTARGWDLNRDLITITGNALDNFITGSDVADAIYGGDGNDWIAGGWNGGNLLSGGRGNDFILTSSGLFGGGPNMLFGGDGDDILNIKEVDIVDGGADYDRVYVADAVFNSTFTFDMAVTHVEWIQSGWTKDTIYAQNALSGVTVWAADGSDVIYGSNFSDLLSGDDGDDAWIGGGGGADMLYGGDGNDRIDGGAGDDTWIGGDAGNDYITGGSGIDRIDGGEGDDTWLGGEGDADYITGGIGNDRIDGGDGSDTWLGGDGDGDYITGGTGNDRIDGGAGNDTWLGGEADADYITGGEGDDRIDGGGGADIWLGGDAGNDTITGGGDADRIDGGDGLDVIIGGAGADVVTGGAGADTFYFTDMNEGGDTIADWLSGADRIGIAASTFGGGLVEGPLLAEQLLVGAAPTADQDFGQFLFSTTQHKLYWDADGWGVGAAVELCTLSNINTLTANDFLVIS